MMGGYIHHEKITDLNLKRKLKNLMSILGDQNISSIERSFFLYLKYHNVLFCVIQEMHATFNT